MKHREPVSHIMSTELQTVHRKQNLLEVADIFEQNSIRHLPVMNGEAVIGIISRTDVMRVSYGISKVDADHYKNFLQQLEVNEVMTPSPMTVNAKTSIKEVGEILHKHRFSALPVMDEGKLVGIVTTTDMIGYLLDQY